MRYHSQMYAIKVQGQGQESTLHWRQVPDPVLRPGDVLIAVDSAGVNRADLLQRSGLHPVPHGESEILGLEASGVVVDLDRAVEGVRVGDQVCVLLPGGGYAELARAPASLLTPVPAALSLEEAAGVPEVFMTAYSALFLEGHLTEGETVLVHAGASGVGTAAIQLAKRAGCQVIATAGSAPKLEMCRRLGADLTVNYREEPFPDHVIEFTEGRGVDVIVDFVGKDYFAGNIEALASRGRLVHVATLSGADVALNIKALMSKRLTLRGVTLRGRSIEEKAQLRRGLLTRFGADLDRGVVRPVIDRVFPVQEAEEAHRYMAANRNIGKILLSVKGEWREE